MEDEPKSLIGKQAELEARRDAIREQRVSDPDTREREEALEVKPVVRPPVPDPDEFVWDGKIARNIPLVKREQELAVTGQAGVVPGPHAPLPWQQEHPANPLDAATLEAHALPTDAEERKGIPLVTGVLDYFPAALAEIAKVSKAGNDKHNPGEPLHWARGKSMDQADCIGRHLMERGGIDPETGQRHTAQMAWRALALLQLELEEAGAPKARGAQ